MLDVGKLMNCQPIRRYRKLFGRELTDEDDPLSLSQEKGKGLAKGVLLFASKLHSNF
jgi:hypothetical protein